MTATVLNMGDQRRYTRVAMWLHWLIAVAIIYNLASGLLRPIMPRGFFIWHVSSGITILALTIVRVVWRLTHKPPPFLPMKPWEAKLAHGTHFLLYCAMVLLPLSGWAMVSASPPAGSPGAAFVEAQRSQKAATQPDVMPTGAAKKAVPSPAGEGRGGGAAPRPRGPTKIWGIFRLPMISPINEIGRTPEGVPQQKKVHEQFETLHLYGGWIFLALLLLHISGALKHQFTDNEPELDRMGLGRRGRNRA